jgi:heme exporter protein A
MTLQASQLAFARGNRTLFEGVDFELKAGQALRVTGRNGSGKTSLLRLLCGLAEPRSGQIHWHGQPIARVRDDFHRVLTYIGHGSGIKDDLSALENLRISTVLSGQACSEAQALSALNALGLQGRAHVPARVLSQGQRRRVVLARLALPVASPLMVLDEPFNALDQESVAVVTDLLTRQLAAGSMVVYTTHQGQALAASHTHQLHLGEVH